MFVQDLREFFQSKTNWLGLTAIVGGVLGYYTGEVTMVIAANAVMGGLMAITLKDAIAKK